MNPFKDLYIGIDDVSFYDLQLHLGRFRIEWGGPLPLKDSGPPKKSSHGRTTGEASCGL